MDKKNKGQTQTIQWTEKTKDKKEAIQCTKKTNDKYRPYNGQKRQRTNRGDTMDKKDK
jgi:hypothetical protein